MKQLKKLSCVILIFILCVFAVPVHAEGVAPGSGGGPSVPLYMRDCSISDGQKDVSTDVVITLYYSHNVADAAVQSNNTAAISMTDSSGKAVSLSVSYSSVFEYRQEIYVKPSGLQGGTTYILKVASSLMARNGYTTGTTDTITFTTQESASSAEDNNQSAGSGAGNKAPASGSGAGTSGSSAGTSGADAGTSGSKRTGPFAGSSRSASSSNDGSSAVKTQGGTSGGSGTANDPDATADSDDTGKEINSIEEEKMQEALENGLVEETTEQEIVKVSDKKPGRVEASEEETDTDPEEKADGVNTLVAIIVCIIIAVAAVTVVLIYKRAKQDGKKV